MIKTFNRVITWALAIAIVILLVYAGFKHFSKPPSHVREMMDAKEMLKEGEPAFTTQEAEALTKELIPLVEEAAGRKFKQIPKIRLIGRDTLANVLMQDLLPQFAKLMPGANSQKILELVENQAKWMTPLIIGKYGFMDQVLYLIPGNVYPIMNLKKINKRHTQAIIKVLISHELVHALQDQQVGLKKMLDQINGLEASEAFNATIEGHAVFIQDLVGTKLQLNEALFESSRMIAAGNLTFEESMLEMQQKIAEARYENIYLGGRKFIEYHYNKGGNRNVWKILAAPPVDSAMILEPDTYDPTPKDKVDYAGMLKGVERYFGNKEWNIQNTEIPKLTLDAYYQNLDPKMKYELLSKIAHVQTLILKTYKEDASGSVSIIVLKDSIYGPKFISTVEKIALDNAKKLKNSKMYHMENLNFENFSGTNADAGRRLSYTLRPSNGRDVQIVAVRICIGNIVLEILDRNIGLKNEQFIEIAELIFKRWQPNKLSSHFHRPWPYDLNGELAEAAQIKN